MIVEPIVHNAASLLPRPGFLEGLRSLCDRAGALLVFDEVITGFRHHLGGYQAIAGVTPDLTTLGKALGNGFPIAAVAGRAEHMERFSTADGGDVWFAGTCNGNVPGVAAALATHRDARERRGARARLPARRAHAGRPARGRAARCACPRP